MSEDESLPDIDATAVARVASALGLTPTRVQCETLAAFGWLLLRWNRTYNLTSIRKPSQVLTHHLADCLTALPPVQRWVGARGEEVPVRLLDVGSGGGLPGVVWAVMWPRLQVVCVDTVGKKAAFVRQVAAELRLPNLRAVHARVKTLDGRFDVVACRAFATLADFVAQTRESLAADGVWLALKGRRPDDEIAVLPPDIDVFHVEPLMVPGLDAERCLVWMRPRHMGAG